MVIENLSQPTILIVDDTPETVKGLIDSLGEHGFQIIAAPSGEQALDRAEHASPRPELILLDVLMQPGMGGFETCCKLKENDATRDIPVLFLTSKTDTESIVTGFRVGGADYITKPFRHEEVLARVNAHLTNRKLQQQLQEEKARFQALSEATFEGIVIHDEGRITDVNSQIEEMFGYQRTEVIGKYLQDFLTPSSWDIVKEHIHTKDGQPYQVNGKRKNGSSFPVEIQAKAMPYEGRDDRVVAIRDLSPLHILEEIVIEDSYRFGSIIGKSLAIRKVKQCIREAARTDATVLICGESGTGKELVAREIHDRSKRKGKPFIPVNCGAIPETLFEAQFFGYRKGAFTGADRDTPGFFDQAQGSTLFLDEIGELPPYMQVKLLRVLQDGGYHRMGDPTLRQADVRIIAATNKNPQEMIKEGEMRKDFFYRINVIPINVPPLRERKDDIPLLIEHFREQYQEKLEDKECPTIPPQIFGTLCDRSWPGNVRELQNAIERYLAIQRSDFLGDSVPGLSEHDGGTDLMTLIQEKPSFIEAIKELKRRLINSTLAQNNGNQKKTAEILKMPVRSLRDRTNRQGLK